ncbi:MAG: PrsW family glutamic-type intramembrane protease [Chloroflexota bacterium]
MPNKICCVCDTPIEGAVKQLGSRLFCEQHYNKVAHNRKGTWISTIGLIVGLVLFALIVSTVGSSLTTSLSTGGLILAGILLSIIPAVLWLTIFYLQDRVEPEPKSYVFGIFVIGLLLARAVGQPLIHDVFEVNTWSSDSLGLQIISGILVVGMIQEFLKYSAVRYSVFRSQEFDERIDGIIYGAAAGLGYATMLNIDYVIASDGVSLSVGVVRIVVAALAHASFAGVMGYFLGRAKFENMGPFWLPAGLLLAAILNGVVTVALGVITRSGFQVTPINGLILAAVVAMVTFGVLFAIMQSNNRALATQAS